MPSPDVIVPPCNCPTGSGQSPQSGPCLAATRHRQESELQYGYGKTGECCGESGSALTSGDRPDGVPTGCGGEPVRPAFATGPSFEPNSSWTVCTGVPSGSPTLAPTGLPRGQIRAAPAVALPRADGTASGLNYASQTSTLSTPSRAQDAREFQNLRLLVATQAENRTMRTKL